VLPHAELLAPLWAAAPGAPSGRIRDSTEARNALTIPTSAAPDVLRAWGVPPGFTLVAYSVSDDTQPGLVAEFAALITITRQHGRLTLRPPAKRPRLGELPNILWILYGGITHTSDNTLILNNLAVSPAFADQLSRADGDPALGITAELLRLISPSRLINESTGYLQRQHAWLTRPDARPIPKRQQEVLARLEQARPRTGRVPDDQIALLARRYLTLYQLGHRHPLPQLALEFGITRTQARDRIHKARQLGYLQPGTQGRAGAQPGPLLTPNT
jgi:hypothetical protein